jgi:hypothetical protein
MPHEIHLTYTEPLIRRAVLRFWWRTTGWGFMLPIIACLAWLAVLLWTGDRSWQVGVLGTVLTMAFALAATLYVVHWRNSLAKLRALGEPSATLVTTDTTLTMSSSAGSTTLPWSAIQEVWQFPECWLLLFSKAQFVTLPLADVTPEARAFILQRVRTAKDQTSG